MFSTAPWYFHISSCKLKSLLWRNFFNQQTGLKREMLWERNSEITYQDKMPRNRTKKRGVKVELLGNMTLRWKKREIQQRELQPLVVTLPYRQYYWISLEILLSYTKRDTESCNEIAIERKICFLYYRCSSHFVEFFPIFLYIFILLYFFPDTLIFLDYFLSVLFLSMINSKISFLL